MSNIISQGMNFFGWGKGGHEEAAPARPAAGSTAAPRPVSQIRRRPQDLTGAIHTIDATSYQAAPEIAALYRDGISVIVNMAEMTDPDARRLLDYMLGLRDGLLGELQRVTPKVFLLAPQGIETNNDDDEFDGVGDGLLINPAR